MFVARAGHTATRLTTGEVLVTGGMALHTSGSGQEVRGPSVPESVPLDSVELYDPRTGRWSLVGSLAVARFHHTATLLPSG
jgi:hypothetical protein